MSLRTGRPRSVKLSLDSKRGSRTLLDGTIYETPPTNCPVRVGKMNIALSGPKIIKMICDQSRRREEPCSFSKLIICPVVENLRPVSTQHLSRNPSDLPLARCPLVSES